MHEESLFPQLINLANEAEYTEAEDRLQSDTLIIEATRAVPNTDEGITPARFSQLERNNLISRNLATVAKKLPSTSQTYGDVRQAVAALVSLRCQHIAAWNHYDNPLTGRDLPAARAMKRADRVSLIDDIRAEGIESFLRANTPIRSSASAKLTWYINKAARRINVAARHAREAQVLDTARLDQIEQESAPTHQAVLPPMDECKLNPAPQCPACAAKQGSPACPDGRDRVAETVFDQLATIDLAEQPNKQLVKLIRHHMQTVAPDTMHQNAKAPRRAMPCVLFALSGIEPPASPSESTDRAIIAAESLIVHTLIGALADLERDIVQAAKGGDGGRRGKAVREWRAETEERLVALRRLLHP